jgi:hypothetical protein
VVKLGKRWRKRAADGIFGDKSAQKAFFNGLAVACYAAFIR